MAETPLNVDVLRWAYANGYFPMPYNDNQIGWFRPDPRAIIPLDGFHCSRRLARRLRQGRFQHTFNQDFQGVMLGCGEREKTWITPEFLELYGQLHREGNAHSVEVWREGMLVGGTYGVSLGGAFFAESKFHRETDASKMAIYYLVVHLRAKGFRLLEVQWLTPHLKTLGAVEIPDSSYVRLLRDALMQQARF